MFASKVVVLGFLVGFAAASEEGKAVATKRGLTGLAYPVFPAGWNPGSAPVWPPAGLGWPLSAELPALTNQITGGSHYPGSLGQPELNFAKGAAHTIALHSAHAVNAAEVTAALQAAKEASAAAAIAQQRVQQAKETVLIQQKIAAAKEAAAAAAIQRSEAAAATAAAIQRSEAAAAAIHRQEAAAAAAAALQRSEAAAAAAAAIQRSQAAAHAIHKTAAKAAAATAALNHAAAAARPVEYGPWG
ncbi:antifreeze protein Maxi [Cimex lectularius]|uniref:CPR type cuticle protein n=1 Tax=Cimex lectularius TaxID=79782 RepID=A0A8I6SAG4_CIMLE|nr:antifreeze protein Maxi [Cimex lectularius]